MRKSWLIKLPIRGLGLTTFDVFLVLVTTRVNYLRRFAIGRFFIDIFNFILACSDNQFSKFHLMWVHPFLFLA